MSDRMRLSGMYSGMDTEAVIQQLVAVKQTKVTNLKNEQLKLEWKQTKWQDLNSKIYSLYSNTLSNLRLQGSYAKKSTTCSDTTKATVVASEGAINGTQTLKINKVAKTGYLTGAELKGKANGDKWSSTDTLASMDSSMVGKKISVTTGKGSDAKTTEIEITGDMKISEFVTKLNEAGVKASFDEKNQRFFISAKASGEANEFTITDDSGTNSALRTLGIDNNEYLVSDAITTADGTKLTGTEKIEDLSANLVGKTIDVVANGKTTSITIVDTTTIADLQDKFKEAGVGGTFDLKSQSFVFNSGIDDFAVSVQGATDNTDLAALGLDNFSKRKGSDCVKIAAQDSEIVLNGATFKSDSNAFSINGLTINVTSPTEEELSIVTTTDYDGVYNTIKDFLTEYNELINEMDKLYNSDSARKYTMLTDEEKEAMTEEEIEKWEDTIKNSLLRKDSTLSKVMNSMVNIMMEGYESNGQTKYLSDYGIETLSYFLASDNEHHAYHINGDPDDEFTAEKEDELKKALAEDPEGTAEFFANLCKNMYTKLDELMQTSEYSSVYKVYNDKKLKSDYDDYTTRIKEAEEELNDYEDKWYDKFTAMEVALSKLQSNTNAVTSMLGM